MPPAFPAAFPGYELTRTEGLLQAVVAALLIGLFVHLAARVVLDRSTFLRALVAGVLGVLLASLASGLVNQSLVASLLGLAAFALSVALVYRTRFWKGVAVGALAWVLSLVVALVLRALAEALSKA